MSRRQAWAVWMERYLDAAPEHVTWELAHGPGAVQFREDLVREPDVFVLSPRSMHTWPGKAAWRVELVRGTTRTVLKLLRLTAFVRALAG